MAKGLYQVTSGDSYYVRADCEEVAELIYHAAMGNMDLDDAKQAAANLGFEITSEDFDSVDFIEASTIVEPVTE